MNRIQVFCDFDGTVALKDVGNGLFRRFAESSWEEPVRLWKEGRISSKECLERECALARTNYEKMAAYADEQEIDPHFKQFVAFCENYNIPITIVSDGLDFYIERILKRYGLANLPYYYNKLLFEPDERIRPEFPYYEEGCKVCGNCKGYHVRRLRKPGDYVIFVGDGYSDRCGAEEADLVLAKDDLLSYCREKAVKCKEFVNFYNVLAIVKKLIDNER